MLPFGKQQEFLDFHSTTNPEVLSGFTKQLACDLSFYIKQLLLEAVHVHFYFYVIRQTDFPVCLYSMSGLA